MTILYFLDYGKGYGGAVNTLIQQALLMKEAGHCVTFFASDYIGNGISCEYMEKLQDFGVKMERLCYQISGEPEDIDVKCIDDNYDSSLAVIQKHNADLLHSIQLNPLVELISRKLRIPHVMSIYPLSESFFRTVYSDVFPRFLICDSIYWGEKWTHFLNVKNFCVRTVVTQCTETKRGFNQEMLRCIVVGNVYAWKNQYSIIRGFEQAIQSGFVGTLQIYGYAQGDYAKKCESYIIEKNLDERISLMGFISNMDEAYDQADILICGSERESYPNAISEAMSKGLLVISTPVGGVPEVIKDGENGLLTKGYEPRDFTNALMRIKRIVAENKAEDMSESAILTATKVHGRRNIRNALENSYNEVLHEYKPDAIGYCIKDLRREFRPYFLQYNDDSIGESDRAYVRLKIWYMKHWINKITQAIKQEKKFYIWGAGEYGRKAIVLLNTFVSTIKVEAVIDSKKSGLFCGASIISPESFFQTDDGVVFVSLFSGQWEVIKMLEDNNKEYGNDFWVLAPREW